MHVKQFPLNFPLNGFERRENEVEKNQVHCGDLIFMLT